MANKYLDVSATFNGDGTTKDQATVDGGIGAWNDFISSVAGANVNGTFEAGDTLYIRTHDGVSDVTIDVSENIVLHAGTETRPSNIVFDDGSVWTEGGVFTATTSGAFRVKLPSYSTLTCEQDKFVFESSYINNGAVLLELNHCICDGIRLRSAKSTSSMSSKIATGAATRPLLRNATMEVRGHYRQYEYYTVVSPGSYSCPVFENFTLDYTDNANQGLDMGVSAIFDRLSYGCEVKIRGLCVKGGWAGLRLFTTSNASNLHVLDMRDISYDGDFKVIPDHWMTSKFGAHTYRFRVQGVNGNSLDTINFDGMGMQTFEESGNYPTLNATLPTGAYWSYKVAPTPKCSKSFPFYMSELLKVMTDISAVKTISVEMLLSEGYTMPTNSDWYIVLSYRDENGVTRSETSINNHPLLTSTAAWSLTYYGEKNYNKYKLEMSTKHAVKQGTAISVSVVMAREQAAVNDFFFICPDFKVV